MSSIVRIGCPSGVALLALLALLCSFQAGSNGVAEALKNPFRHKEPREWDDYDGSFADHRESRRSTKLKAANANWDTFKNSALFLEPVEDGLTKIPIKQLEFEYEVGLKNMAMFKEIVRDAIKYKDDLFGSAKLIAKWALKLITTMIKNRREEMAISPRYEPKGSFFTRMADALAKIVSMSTEIKRQKGYDRYNVDIKKFEQRTMEILSLAVRIFEISPVGIFLKWDNLKLYMDDPKHPLHGKPAINEGADLFAQFRAIGYESAAFMANRMVDLLRTFAKGEIPKSARAFI